MINNPFLLGFISIIFIAFLFYPNSANSLFDFQNKAPTFITFEDSSFGISIKYPLDWQKETRINNFVTFLSPKESGNQVSYPAGFGIKKSTLQSSNVSLNTITTTQLADLNKLKEFVLLESGTTVIAEKIPAHKVVFTALENNDIKRKSMQIWFKDKNNVFLITFKALPESYDKYKSVADEMINSLRLTQ